MPPELQRQPAVQIMRIYLNIVKVLLIVLFCAGSSYGQNIVSGRVLSMETGEALDRVNIFEEDVRNKTIFVTGNDGRFEIDIGSRTEVSLGFRRIGYKDEFAVCNTKQKEVTVRLIEDPGLSEEIIVTGTLNSENDLLNTFHINSGLNSVDELISRANGVALIRRGNFGAEPVIRGLSSDRMSIRLDGMKIQPACTDKMDPVTSYAETDNLKSISISKGAFDDDDCASSCSGIDMKLKNAETSDKLTFNSSVNAGYMSVSKGIRFSGNADLRSNNFGNYTNITYRSSSDYKDGHGAEIDYSGFNKINISNSTVYKPGAVSSLKADVLYDYAWDVGYPALTMDVKDAEAIITGLQFNTGISSSFAKYFESKIYYNKITHVMDDSQRDNRIKMDMPGWTNTTGAYIKSGMDFFDADVELRAEGIISNANADMTMYAPGQAVPMYMVTWPDVRKNEFSFSVSGKKHFGSEWAMSLRAWGGPVNSEVRSDIGLSELQIFYPDFSGSDSRFAGGAYAGIEKTFGDHVTAGLNLSYSQRDLSVSEQYAFYIFNRFDSYDYIGNPYLNGEVSGQADIELDVTYKDISVRTSFFGYHIKDYIAGQIDSTLSPMTENSNGVKFYQSIPWARIIGFEQSMDIRLSDKVRIANNIQYTYGYDNANEYLPLMPPLMGNLSSRYSQGIYAVQGEMLWAAAQNKVNSDYGESRTPSYAVFNLRGSVELSRFLSVDAGIENIFDTFYYEHLDWQKTPRPGRSIYAALRSNF